MGGLFDKQSGHPLADKRELQRIIGELPADNAFKALDEIGIWLDSLLAGGDLPPVRSFDAARQLADAAAPHLRRLAHEYLHTPRLSRAEESRLWSIHSGFWSSFAEVLERALITFISRKPTAEQARQMLPALCTYLIGALRTLVKWEQFRYGPPPKEVWRRLGQALLATEAVGVSAQPVATGVLLGNTSALTEYRKAVIFQAASMDSLLPMEIELAECFVSHFLASFDFLDTAEHDCVYWLDLRVGQPPQRLAKMPEQLTPTQRFYRPGAGHGKILAVLRDLERGGDVPPEINLGGQYPVKTLLPVLRHLCAYLAPVPPQRRHDRHRVRHQMQVLHGLVNSFVVFSKEFGGQSLGLQPDSWQVDNVSRGGFGVVLNETPKDWLRVGTLLALQPAGGENWLLGCVRRFYRGVNSESRIGIQTLSRQVEAAELTPLRQGETTGAGAVPILILLEGNLPGEVRLVMPPHTFDSRERFEYTLQGQAVIFESLLLLEHNSDYEIARYRLLPAA